MPVKRHGIVHKRLFTLQLRAAYVEKYQLTSNKVWELILTSHVSYKTKR